MDSGHGIPPWLRPFGNTYRMLDLDSRQQDEASQQAACAQTACELRAGDRVLDIACATGRHAVEFARRGYQVTGVDLNPGYLELAAQRARAAGVRIETVAHDMRELAALGAACFDAAVVMYSSFGYFVTRADNLRVIEGARHVLRPGGRLLLDLINRDWFVRNYYPSDYAAQGDQFVTRDFQVAGGRVFLHENVFRPLLSRLSWSVTIPGDPDSGFTLDYRMYSAHEIAELVEDAGMKVWRLFGGYDCGPFTLLSPRIICVATRLCPAGPRRPDPCGMPVNARILSRGVSWPDATGGSHEGRRGLAYRRPAYDGGGHAGITRRGHGRLRRGGARGAARVRLGCRPARCARPGGDHGAARAQPDGTHTARTRGAPGAPAERQAAAPGRHGLLARHDRGDQRRAGQHRRAADGVVGAPAGQRLDGRRS
jgi:SAM-dependent methyltransferase